MNPLTDALWAIDDHHHATKASITTDQKIQSIEMCLRTLTVRRVHVASFVQQAQAQQGCALVDIIIHVVLNSYYKSKSSLAIFTSDGHCYELQRYLYSLCSRCKFIVFVVSQCVHSMQRTSDVNSAKLATQF